MMEPLNQIKRFSPKKVDIEDLEMQENTKIFAAIFLAIIGIFKAEIVENPKVEFKKVMAESLVETLGKFVETHF